MEQAKNYVWGEDVFTLLSWFKPEKVRNARVLVAGGGALGNEVVKNLALFGVGNIVVVDFDTIEMSNLTRSVLFREKDALKSDYKAKVIARRAKEINPDIHVKAICGDLAADVGLGLYRRMDVVIGCLDSRYARYMLNTLAFRVGKTWVDGSIENLDGTVRVFKPGVNCYECALTKEEFENIMLKTGCADVVQANVKAGRIATTPISASVVGAIQVQEAMKVIHQEELDSGKFTSLLGKMFKYEGMRFSTKVFTFQNYNKECTAHEVWDRVTEADDLSAKMKLSTVLKRLRERFEAKQVEINLRNNKFVDKIISKRDEQIFSVRLPQSKIEAFVEADPVLNDLRYKDTLYQEVYENINESFPYPELTLQQIGVPLFDILQVSTDKGMFFVELSKDKKYFETVV